MYFMEPNNTNIVWLCSGAIGCAFLLTLMVIIPLIYFILCCMPYAAIFIVAAIFSGGVLFPITIFNIIFYGTIVYLMIILIMIMLDKINTK